VVITLDFESKNPSSNLGKSCFQLVVLGEKSTYLTRLAQLVERMPFKHVVVGSSPTSGGNDPNMSLNCLLIPG
jgi:hypothetical protein